MFQARAFPLACLSAVTASTILLINSSYVFADTANSVTNLATGASITIGVTGVPDNQFQGYESAYANSLTSTNAWHGFCRQGGRDITVTLPADSTIESISIDLEQDASQGIQYPREVEFQVNRNGSWYSLATVQSAIPLTDIRRTVQTFSVHLNQVTGQTFRIHFPVGVWVFARNLRIMGTTGGASASVQLKPVPEAPPIYNQPMSPYDSRDRGIYNMLLVYTGAYGSSDTWSVNDFLPMVAYQPQNGPVTSHMFDTMLFLPYGAVPKTETGWQSYLNDLFAPNQQLSALDEAVGQQNQVLNTPGYQENVVLTIPYCPYGTNDWGQLNGQDINFGGSPVDPFALHTREAVMSWYLQTLFADWNAAHFQHLHLIGVYWENEQSSSTAPKENELIQYVGSQVHAQNLALFWIPFYGAANLSNWSTLGFDTAWIQPNYVEMGQNADISRLTNAEAMATRSGLGVELELNGLDSLNETLYEQTLQKFEQDYFGQNVSHAFYAGSKDLVNAANSMDRATRALYDDTYQFMNHS